MFVQVALAVVLLVASGLMIRSFQALRSVEPGFADPDHIQTMRISIPEGQAAAPERVARMQQDILNEIARITRGHVRRLRQCTAHGVGIREQHGGDRRGQDLRRRHSATEAIQDHSLRASSRTLGIPLLAGRDFTWTDVHDRRAVAVVSNTLASELWGGPSAALGKRIRVGRAGPLSEIVGVVGDISDSGVNQSPPAIVYWRAGAQAAAGRRNLSSFRAR